MQPSVWQGVLYKGARTSERGWYKERRHLNGKCVWGVGGWVGLETRTEWGGGGSGELGVLWFNYDIILYVDYYLLLIEFCP
jgi:hypothetical protein